MHRATDLTVNLQKAASTSDVLQLLRLWNAGESPEAFQRRVVEENLLGKASRRRVHDLVTRVLRRRYLPDDDPVVAQRLQRLLRSTLPRSVVLKIVYYHTAAAEHVLYRIASEFLYELRRAGGVVVRRDDLVRFVRTLLGGTYTKAVLERVSRSAATALRDFGILEGKSHKRIAPVHLSPEAVGYVVHTLRAEGHTARAIVRHSDWRLFLLTEREAEEAVAQAAARGFFVYSAAGDIKRFDWRYEGVDEYASAIA